MSLSVETKRKLHDMGASDLLAAFEAQDEGMFMGMTCAKRVQMAVDEANSPFVTSKVRNPAKRAGLRYPEADVRSIDFTEGTGWTGYRLPSCLRAGSPSAVRTSCCRRRPVRATDTRAPCSWRQPDTTRTAEANRRLHSKVGRLRRRGVKANKANVAVTRVFAGFVWALAVCEV